MLALLFHLDANTVNSRQTDPHLNKLEYLASVGVVKLEYSEVAYDEAEYGSVGRKTKVEKFTWAGLANQPELEDSWRRLIADAVFPSGVITASQRNDVEILLTAKIAGAILVTNDGASKSQGRGILGSKMQLDALGIQVLNPAEAAALASAAAMSKFNIAKE
jgi:hypothetical protein